MARKKKKTKLVMSKSEKIKKALYDKDKRKSKKSAKSILKGLGLA